MTVQLGASIDIDGSVRDARPRREISLRRRTADTLASDGPHHCFMQQHRVSVVIPALNEAENLPHVLPHIPDWVDEVLIVDGLSTDGTPDTANQLWSKLRRRWDDPRLRIVMQQKRGKGAALRAGFEAATGDIIVMLDADGSTNPREIPRFVGALLSGADFAKGSRFLQGGGTADMPVYRQLGNWGFVTLVRLLFGGRYTDLCYGYNAFWRHAIHQLELDGDGFEIETMMNVRALKAGLRLTEVPSFEAARVYGEGRLRTIPDGWRVLKSIYREWRAAKTWEKSASRGEPAAVMQFPTSGSPVGISQRQAESFAESR